LDVRRRYNAGKALFAGHGCIVPSWLLAEEGTRHTLSEKQKSLGSE
jgi:hypothetical protein